MIWLGFLLALQGASPLQPLQPPQAQPPLGIHSNTACPDAAQVAAKLNQLFPPALFGAVNERIEIASAPTSLRIDLSHDDGTPIVARVLKRSGDCAEMAGAVAVVVVAWEIQLHPELLAPPQLARRTSPVEAPPAVAAPARAAPPAVIAQTPSGTRAPREPLEARLMLGALASLVDGAWSAGARASILASQRGGSFGLAADLWGGSSRAIELGPGRVQWHRLGAALGPAWRRQRAPWTVIASIQAAVGRVAAQGLAFDVNQRSNDTLPGFGAGLMATMGSDRWFAWVSVRALIWPIQSRVQAVAVATTSALPIARSLGWLESDLTLGAGLRLP